MATNLASGKLSIEEYIKITKINLDELIKFAKKANMQRNVIVSLYRQKAKYDRLIIPKKKENYLKHTTLLVDGKEIKPTSEDVDKVIEYLNQNKVYVCKHTVESTVRQYLKGEIVLQNNEEKQIKLQKKEEEKKKLEKEEEKIDELERLIKRNKERVD